MNYLSVENISMSFGDRVLFEGVSFGVAQGEKTALVGVNGSGKSTLLKIIAGKESPDSGNLSFRNGLRVAYLSQNPDLPSRGTVLDAVFDEEDPVMQLIKEYEHCLVKAETDEEYGFRLADLSMEMEAAGAWDHEARVKEILGKLNIHNLDQAVDTLSGGQKKRVAMASLFIKQPDLIIMDEPTNHLDVSMIEWLENYLSKANLSLLLVTHDRYFLESVTNAIIEIDREQVFRYEGNYSYYLEKKQERELQLKTETEKARNLMRKELEWIRRQPKARGTKAKYRVQAFDELQKKASKNLVAEEMTLSVGHRRLGKKILELDSIEKSFDDKKIIRPFTYTFKTGEKIGILGENGVGKSTFLNMLTGRLSPDSGTLDVGLNTKFGYYTQEELTFTPGQKVIDIIKDIAEVITMADGKTVTASQYLGHFMFPPKVQQDFVEKLSGGEKRRLQLMTVLAKDPNFLILDEPTNDLDLLTLSILEDFLINFQGCLIIASHDRYFMDRLVQHVFVFQKGRDIKDYPYNYSQYREFARNSQEEKITMEKKTQAEKIRLHNKRKLSFQEKKEFEELEPSIKLLESEKKILTDKLYEGKGSFDELTRWSEQIEKLTQQIEEKEARWLELSEIEGS
ncbi:MAG: ABC-F family ATP-binding cassette domain-containing protein [Cyclobacteriaceae bacterium]|nr:ABC-F family ATP-binding cassette domain-containing protein [Cyclobacteriaceae bacterium]